MAEAADEPRRPRLSRGLAWLAPHSAALLVAFAVAQLFEVGRTLAPPPVAPWAEKLTQADFLYTVQLLTCGGLWSGARGLLAKGAEGPLARLVDVETCAAEPAGEIARREGGWEQPFRMQLAGFDNQGLRIALSGVVRAGAQRGPDGKPRALPLDASALAAMPAELVPPGPGPFAGAAAAGPPQGTRWPRAADFGLVGPGVAVLLSGGCFGCRRVGDDLERLSRGKVLGVALRMGRRDQEPAAVQRELVLSSAIAPALAGWPEEFKLSLPPSGALLFDARGELSRVVRDLSLLPEAAAELARATAGGDPCCR